MKKLVSLILGVLVCTLFCTNINAQSHTPLNAEEAIKELKEGNQRFSQNKRKFPHQNKYTIEETNKNGQHPFATVITCSDSRVPVEELFDAGIGDIFTIRVAGNVINTDEAGSIEYGVEHLHTPVFVVLGHSSCGAVTAVCQGSEIHGNIPLLVKNIVPAVNKAKADHGETFSEELLNASIKNNIWQSVEDLLKISHISSELVKSGKLKIVGALYHLEDGHIEWLGEHPNQDHLIHSETAHHH